MILIDDRMVSQIIASPKILGAIPALKAAVGQKPLTTKKCKPCQRKARAAAIDYTNFKRVIGRMSAESKIKLKQLLNTDKVQILFRSESNKLIRVTF